MALLADGWHKGLHALAIGVTVHAMPPYAGSPRAAFGSRPGRIEVLGAFAGALLPVVALLMVAGSVEWLLSSWLRRRRAKTQNSRPGHSHRLQRRDQRALDQPSRGAAAFDQPLQRTLDPLQIGKPGAHVCQFALGLKRPR